MTARLILCVILGALLVQSCSSEPPPSKKSAPLFKNEVPQNLGFKQELTYLESTGRLSGAAKHEIESAIENAEKKLGVPKTLLWCLLFQESRFDEFMGADQDKGARGLGQFTRHALSEINEETNHYDSRTEAVFEQDLKPLSLPITFDLIRPADFDFTARIQRKAPPQPKNSYFNASTAVLGSAAYLNNRYSQLKHSLEKNTLHYDPQVLWLYAAAAYNKGARSVFVVLSQQRMYGGEPAVAELLQSTKLSYALLTHKDLLDYSLSEVFSPEKREKYIIELTRNMESILSCALPEAAGT